MSEQKQQQPEFEQQLIDAAYINIAQRGALVVFSQLRDEAISDAKNFQNVAENYLAENEVNAAERAEIVRIANVSRNKIIALQAAVDASFAFENITSNEGRSIN
jgi:hypothetical protein